MGTRTQHTKTDLSRCVARLLLAAQHARLAVGSRRGGPPLVRVRFGGNSPPLANELVRPLLRPNFLLSCARFRELFLLLWCQATVCAWHCGPARVLPAARAAAATPRRATSRCRAAFPAFAESRKAAELAPNRFFFFELFLEI